MAVFEVCRQLLSLTRSTYATLVLRSIIRRRENSRVTSSVQKGTYVKILSEISSFPFFLRTMKVFVKFEFNVECHTY